MISAGWTRHGRAQAHPAPGSSQGFVPAGAPIAGVGWVLEEPAGTAGAVAGAEAAGSLWAAETAAAAGAAGEGSTANGAVRVVAGWETALAAAGWGTALWAAEPEPAEAPVTPLSTRAARRAPPAVAIAAARRTPCRAAPPVMAPRIPERLF